MSAAGRPVRRGSIRMDIAPGTKLGPYEIEDRLGQGGMGEVWRATDSRLDRVVALKLLPAALADDAQFQSRFDREARAISSLAHPNICRLYDIGEEMHGGKPVRYLVMEYLEGETLADRLERGPLPLDAALEVSTEITTALEIAHAAGIVHRDLKPGNVMLTSTGAKLLDFGLAKGHAGVDGATDVLTHLATEAEPLTQEGTIVGTFQYMAPEQLHGGAADPRSDIFALGALLFEMLTGRRAFEAKSKVGLIAAILEHDPPSITTSLPLAPPALERLISTCLRKEPAERWQTAHDVRLQLEWIAEGGSQAGVPAPVAAKRKGRERLAWATVAVATAATVLFALLWWRTGDLPRPVVQSSLVANGGTTVLATEGLALSPEGARLAFVGRDEETGRTKIFVRPLAGLTAQSLAGTDNAYGPFWSPDGRSLGFFADGELKRVPASGGAVQSIADAPEPRGGTWGPDGTIVFNGSFRDGLFRVDATGGAVDRLTELDRSRGEISHRWPSFLPDGGHVLFLVQTNEGSATVDESTIETLSLETRERSVVLRANSSMQYVDPGYLLFWQKGLLVAQPFDLPTRQTTDSFFPLASDVTYSTNELAAFTATADRLVMQTGTGTGVDSVLVWIDRNGTGDEMVSEEGSIVSPRLSPTADRLAVVSEGDVHVTAIDAWSPVRLTFDPGDDLSPAWSPDGEWIAYASRSGREIRRKLASGLGEEELVYTSETLVGYLDWSADGRYLAFAETGNENLSDIAILDLESGEKRIVVGDPHSETQPRFSPDGRWLVYVSEESGDFRVYVAGLGEGGGKYEVSTLNAQHPLWGKNGEIFFAAYPGAEQLYAVAVESTEGGLSLGSQVELGGYPLRVGYQYSYDVSLDGTRILGNSPMAFAASSPMTLVQNWTELASE